ncbi:MAG: hypothetical protein FJ147_05800 [Deltaproteobacteria bacterium]|nr:hypothetical protein [Deltaproteobacteria bacterium]
MHHTRCCRLSLWIVTTLFSLSFLTAPAFAQDTPRKKKSEPRDTDTEDEEKPSKKKRTEKEKKPQLQILGSKVAYSAPRRWTKPQTSTREKLEALQFVIPLPSASGTSRVTSAIVVAEPNADKMSLTDFSNSKLPRKYPAGTIVADQADGDSWRTVVSHVHEANPPYTVVDRFGVASGLRVHFRVIFPKEDDAKASWLKTLGQESNDFIRSLSIGNKNKVSADLFYDAGQWGLRAAKPGKSVATKDTGKDPQKPKQDVQKAKATPVKKTPVKSSPKVGEEFSQ